MIEFRMLGEIRLKTPDGTEVDAIIRQPKRLAVLAYLASPTPGTRHRRDLLLALFWPELDTSHARTSLRNALYVLRQSLGDDVIHSKGDEEVSVNPELLRTDLSTVLDALKDGRIDDALAAYGGELLPGLYPADSEGFHRWLDSERTRLKVAVSSAAAGRLNDLESRKEFSQALGIARRMLEIQPDDETIVRRAMTLHEALGDMAGGLNLYEKYRNRLAADFDAAPSPETSALADRLRSAPRPSSTRPKPSAVPEPRPVTDVSAASEMVAPDEPSFTRTPESQRRWAIPVGALALMAVAAGGWLWIRPAPTRPSESSPQTIGAIAPVTSEEGLQVEAAISPNGRFIAYAKGNTSHLQIYVQTIGSGQARRLIDDSISHQIVPRWSPTGDQLLFLAGDNAYVTPAIGGEPRLVARGSSGDGMVRSASWSPCGDSVAIVRNDSLMVQPLEGPPTRYIGTGYQLHSCVWSPDGKWIACTSGNWIEFEAGPIFGNRGQSSIALFPAAGGKSIPLTDTTYQNRAPAWSADGKFLWFLSNRGGDQGEMYAIPIGSDGHISGPVVRQGLRAEWISLTEKRIAYSESVRQANVWRIPISHGAALDINAADTVTSGTSLTETVSVSDDGKWLFYDSDENGNPDIYRKALPRGTPLRITTDKHNEYTPSLSPDGSELAWQRWNDKGKRRIVVRKLDGDAPPVDIVPADDTTDRGGPRWSPDGNAIAGWIHAKTEGKLFVVKRDASGRWQKVSWTIPDAQLPVWSPDGKTIAFVKNDGSIESIPADSGARKKLYTVRPGSDDQKADNIAWTKSPDTLWFIAHRKSGAGSIWSLALSTGARKLLARFDDPARLTGLTIATDQKYFYFTLDQRFSNVHWAELVKK